MSSAPSILNSQTLAQAWLTRVHHSPHETALHFENQAWSYAQLHTLILNVARQLEHHQLHAGQRVMILMDNGPSFIASFFAAQLLGLIPVPVSPRSSPQRIAYIVDDCQIQLIAHDQDLSARVREQHHQQIYRNLLYVVSLSLETVTDERTVCTSPTCAFIQYTSGSSGAAKGVMISHRAALNNIASFTAEMDLQAGDRFSSMLPLFHDMGLLCFGLAPLLLGHTLWLYRAESLQLYSWLSDLSQHGIRYTGAPDSLLQIANRVVTNPEHYSLHQLKMLICGSEPIRLNTIERFGQRFKAKHAIAPAYGMAELSLCASLTAFPCTIKTKHAEHVACGRAIAGVEIRIADEHGQAVASDVSGEILVRSSALMMGYWGKPEASARALTTDGFLRTGDHGFMDQDGDLYVVGRIKNLLIKAGEKHSPHELESCLQKHHAVRRAAVIQSARSEAKIFAIVELDRRLLTEPKALLQLTRDLKRACFLAHDVAPDVCGFVSGGALPATENGKLKHAELRLAIDAGNYRAVWSTDLEEADHALALA